MIVLTIDTSSGMSVGVAEVADGVFRKLAAVASSDARHHAEHLTPAVQDVLSTAGLDRPDAVVVGTGPAAFTGLRAGLVTARVFARGWGIPVYGVSSLEVMALQASNRGAQEVVAMIDARRKEVYALRARPMGGDDVAVIDPAEVVTPAVLAEQLRREPAVLAAASTELYEVELGERLVVPIEPVAMARLVWSRLTRIEAGEDVDLGTEPQYLRRPDIHGGATAQPKAEGNPYEATRSDTLEPGTSGPGK